MVLTHQQFETLRRRAGLIWAFAWRIFDQNRRPYFAMTLRIFVASQRIGGLPHFFRQAKRCAWHYLSMRMRKNAVNNLKFPVFCAFAFDSEGKNGSCPSHRRDDSPKL
ncbi:MAG: hypothetical protein ACK5NN_13595 [Sphingomonadaceae bacterium]